MSSCGEVTVDKEANQENILSVEVFTDLMTDVQLLEGHLNTNRVNQVFIMDSSKNYYKEIFNRYEITPEIYKENLKYYTAKPKVLEAVYKNIEEKLVIQERVYKDVLIDQPAISPINKNQLIKILLKDSSTVNFVLDTNYQYLEIKDSLFAYYNDSILKPFHTNHLSFQQSFNVTTHTAPLFKLFKQELQRKLTDKVAEGKY
jgi:hypothetical protein